MMTSVGTAWRRIERRRMWAAPVVAVAVMLTLVGCEAPVPQPSLTAVSCPVESKCVAVGRTLRDLFTATSLSEHGGSSWSIAATPNPRPLTEPLGVSCSSTSDCIAVGQTAKISAVHGDGQIDGSSATMSMHWNGSRWSLLRTPSPAAQRNGGGALISVSCTASSNCVAVGAANDAVLSERWNGARWATLRNPQLPGGLSGNLDSISCYDGGCLAVGVAASNKGQGREQGLAEQWDGTQWTLASPAPPHGASDWSLDTVSCSGPTSCVAVGGADDGDTGTQLLFERWDGHSWAPLAGPAVAPSDSALQYITGISCPSATNCTATGLEIQLPAGPVDANTVVHSTALVGRWNGTTWVLAGVPLPRGATDSELSGVSCPSTDECTAVGAAVTAARRASTLIERWTPSTGWRPVPSANPRSAAPADLSLRALRSQLGPAPRHRLDASLARRRH